MIQSGLPSKKWGREEVSRSIDETRLTTVPVCDQSRVQCSKKDFMQVWLENRLD